MCTKTTKDSYHKNIIIIQNVKKLTSVNTDMKLYVSMLLKLIMHLNMLPKTNKLHLINVRTLFRFRFN